MMTEKSTRRSFLRATAASTVAASAVTAIAAHPPAERGRPDGPAEIVDAHVHLKHGDAARTEYSPEVIVETMDRVGIGRSVVFAMSTTTRKSIEMAEKAVQSHPQRLIPYVYALPHYERPVIREIEAALAGSLFRGIKIHAGECTLADYVLDPVLRIAGEYGVPCLIDCGGRYDDARRMARSFPGTRLIFAHMGRYLATDAGLIDRFLGLAEECSNVLLDASGVVLVEKIVDAVRRIGSRRLIWGTDGPHPKPDTVGFARAELDKIRNLSLDQADKDNILGGTIREVLGL